MQKDSPQKRISSPVSSASPVSPVMDFDTLLKYPPLYTAEQTRQLDKLAIEHEAITGFELMQRAGHAAFKRVCSLWPQAKKITVFCGGGNNAGDGYVVAKLALNAGYTVQLIALTPMTDLSGDARLAAQECHDLSERHVKYNAEYLLEPGDESYRPVLESELLYEYVISSEKKASQEESSEEESSQEKSSEGKKPLLTADALAAQITGCVIVDGLLGTGADRDLTGVWLTSVQAINISDAPVLALDIPSGLHADTGQTLVEAVIANYTVAFIGFNRGLYSGQARRYVGEILFENCSVPDNVYTQVFCNVFKNQPSTMLTPRVPTAHKGDFGFVLALGGDTGMPGAVFLCACAALRMGAGRVAVASRSHHLSAVFAQQQPELMFRDLDQTGQICIDGISIGHVVGKNLGKNRKKSSADGQDNSPATYFADDIFDAITVIVCGPGLGRSSWGRYWFDRVFQEAKNNDVPVVMDADALYWLAKAYFDNQPHYCDHWVLTPHPGEAATLLGCAVDDIENDRFAAVQSLQQRYGGVVALKGAGTLIADGENIWVNTTGNAALATGGTGDVLAGMIAGLLAQGLSPIDAATFGVWKHGETAELIKPKAQPGMVASDLLYLIALAE